MSAAVCVCPWLPSGAVRDPRQRRRKSAEFTGDWWEKKNARWFPDQALRKTAFARNRPRREGDQAAPCRRA
ncbi:hypothetical protein GCM10027066_07740 [Dyella jejuensis]